MSRRGDARTRGCDFGDSSVTVFNIFPTKNYALLQSDKDSKHRVITSDVDEWRRIKKENTVAMHLKGLPSDSVREDLSEYVAHLQLHMALQARNLVPSLSQTIVDSRQQMLHQTQATFEKMVSRQTL